MMEEQSENGIWNILFLYGADILFQFHVLSRPKIFLRKFWIVSKTLPKIY